VFGLENEVTKPIQVTGNVQAMEGRCVVFPNFMQHCVAPFELADPSKPGYRKILAFFLVNPAHNILSTLNVPPQQASWRERELKSTLGGKVPDTCAELISKSTEGTMTHDDAKKYMIELMKERKASEVYALSSVDTVSLW